MFFSNENKDKPNEFNYCLFQFHQLFQFSGCHSFLLASFQHLGDAEILCLHHLRDHLPFLHFISPLDYQRCFDQYSQISDYLFKSLLIHSFYLYPLLLLFLFYFPVIQPFAQSQGLVLLFFPFYLPFEGKNLLAPLMVISHLRVLYLVALIEL
jgi:hypothetical protein